jgi:hypothetical protein
MRANQADREILGRRGEQLRADARTLAAILIVSIVEILGNCRRASL